MAHEKGCLSQRIKQTKLICLSCNGKYSNTLLYIILNWLSMIARNIFFFLLPHLRRVHFVIVLAKVICPSPLHIH